MSDTENPASGHWAAPDEVWARVRADYSDGLSGPACCRRHGVKLTTLRDRAAREGWRRIDQAGPPANRLDPDDEGVQLEIECGGDLDRIDFAQLSYVAVRRMMRAVMRGSASTDRIPIRTVRTVWTVFSSAGESGPARLAVGTPAPAARLSS